MYYDTIQVDDPQLSDFALSIFEKRYLRGETPKEMFQRVASFVAQAELNYLDASVLYADNQKIEVVTSEEAQKHVWKATNDFYKIMATLDFLPNSPTLLNAGREQGQLAACFVVPVEDSMEGIFSAIKDMALIQRTGGGTGFNFSKLRPEGSLVSSTVGEASGPLSFMQAFDACTNVVKQGGARRGANMGILRVDHPDILQFIRIKQDLSKLTNFNISVGITDEFMQAIGAENDSFALRHGDKVYQIVSAREIWDEICLCAHGTGDPGLIFLDTIERGNPTPHLGKLDCTNPCGEQPLLPYEACNLGSINLVNMYKMDGFSDKPEDQIDWEHLWDTVTLAVRFLDDVIDVGRYPLPIIAEKVKQTRKIGLGVMGWADLLFRIGIPYDSEEARRLAGIVMSQIQDAANDASIDLATERGVYPALQPEVANIKRRNASLTTIAPTGTISIAAGVSSGIEPIFALCYTKHLTDGGEETIFNSQFEQCLEGLVREGDLNSLERTIVEDYVRNNGTLHGCDLVPELVQEVFCIASDIDPLDHIRMQAAFQEKIDNAVSKTINMPAETEVEEIDEAFRFAYQLGCKGITVYRDGCRDSQPLTKGTSTQKVSEVETPPAPITQLQRPAELIGKTTQVKTGCGTMFVTVNMLDGKPYEVFLRAGAMGGCAAFTEGVARLLSIALRNGIPAEKLIDQLTSVSCPNFRFQVGRDASLKGKSCPDVIGRILKEALLPNLGSSATMTQDIKDAVLQFSQKLSAASFTGEELELRKPAAACPECGELTLQQTEGCVTCSNCGYSHC